MRNGTTQDNNAMLSLYIDGKYCECNVHSMPFLKESVIMLPLKEVASELGYRVERHREEGYELIYRNSVFEKEVLTIRYVLTAENGIAVSYYYQNGEFIPLPPVEIIEEEIFIPMELLTAALRCSCQASPSGNINIRSKHETKPDDELHQKLLSENPTAN